MNSFQFSIALLDKKITKIRINIDAVITLFSSPHLMMDRCDIELYEMIDVELNYCYWDHNTCHYGTFLYKDPQLFSSYSNQIPYHLFC